jgi:UDP-2-acetamido-3-amino-2,3-dideoxy-glucuronate N-acetyltransferase
LTWQRISPDVVLGDGVVVRDFVNLYGCTIGAHSRVGTFVEIQRGVEIGQRCKISSHTFICEGVVIEDDVFIGHNVSFTNDRYPRAAVDGRVQSEDDWSLEATVVRRGASIGSGTTILCGVEIGEGAMIGAGSLVADDIPPGVVVRGPKAVVVRNLGER